MKSARYLVLLTLGLPLNAHAVLGERAPASQKVVSKAAVVSTNTIRVQTTAVDNGLTIKEFVDSTGLVYAVRWEGSHPPDLDALLGQYFPEYRLAVITSTKRIPRRRVAATSESLEISQFVHPGALIGIIYLKNNLPAGIQPEDLK